MELFFLVGVTDNDELVGALGLACLVGEGASGLTFDIVRPAGAD